MKLGRSARGLSTLYGASLLVSFGHGMTIPTIPLMVEYFDVSLFWGAQIITAYGIGALVGTPPAGIVADKFGVRITLIMGPVLIVGAALAVVLAPWFWLVLLAMVFAGAGNSTWMIGREIAGALSTRAAKRGIGEDPCQPVHDLRQFRICGHGRKQALLFDAHASSPP